MYIYPFLFSLRAAFTLSEAFSSCDAGRWMEVEQDQEEEEGEEGEEAHVGYSFLPAEDIVILASV